MQLGVQNNFATFAHFNSAIDRSAARKISTLSPLKKANPERSENFLLRSDVTRPSAA
jgi:hypothetical protein